MIGDLISPSRPPQAQPATPIAHRAKSQPSELPFERWIHPAERATHDSKPPSPPTSRRQPAAARPGRNEHWRRSPKPLAQQRESSSSPKPTCERRPGPAEPHQYYSGAGPGRNELWRRSPKPLAQQRENSSSPKPTCERRPGPAEPAYFAAEESPPSRRSNSCTRRSNSGRRSIAKY